MGTYKQLIPIKLKMSDPLNPDERISFYHKYVNILYPIYSLPILYSHCE